ncbi:hypothetical protein SBA3_4360010 [Candidatus Sulfopaludibacter sp. SbA3]|nr:hypothetical protein SBA3_4360010 [Candidatus Sulfopaludibacter sp. SbA3]
MRSPRIPLRLRSAVPERPSIKILARYFDQCRVRAEFVRNCAMPNETALIDPLVTSTVHDSLIYRERKPPENDGFAS